MWYPKWCLWSLSIITCLHHVFLNHVKTLQLHIRPSSNSLSKKATHLATTCHKIWYLFLTSATKKYTDHLFDLLIVENTFSRDTHVCVYVCCMLFGSYRTVACGNHTTRSFQTQREGVWQPTEYQGSLQVSSSALRGAKTTFTGLIRTSAIAQHISCENPSVALFSVSHLK